jgi:uncharacterized protein (TIGR00255 family)
MKSMTGYGYYELENKKMHASIDLKSYNHRYLDIQINLPVYLNPLELKLREYLSSRINRGRVELVLRFTEMDEELDIQVDKNIARAYIESISHLAKILGSNEKLHLPHLLRFEGILKIKKIRNMDLIWNFILQVLENAFQQLENSRLSEGKSIEKDIMRLLKNLERESKKIVDKRPKIEEQIKSQILARFKELLGENMEIERVYAETAVMLIKYDINEEISRIKAHLNRFKEIAKQGGGMGKSLDFIAQELNREINTIASKNISIDISSSVITFKNDLEKIREQLRNVE